MVLYGSSSTHYQTKGVTETMSTEVAVQNLDREKIELIKQTVAKGATDLELELFLHACKHTGLDPLMKQIYAIKRWSSAEEKNVLSFQTGIDGLRLIADRTGKYAGSSDAIFEEKDGKPLVAHVTVLKVVGGEKCAFTASARWEEYVQKNRQMQPTSMWAKMPYLMLGKCAEALALRKAFPVELSGLYTHDEMVHLDSEWKDSLQRTPSEILAQSEQPLVPQGMTVTMTAAELHRRATEESHAPETGQDGTGPRHDTVGGQAADPQQASDAAPITDDNADPAEMYRVKLRVCGRSEKEINATYKAIPDTLKQDCYGCYTEQLNGLKGKK